MPNFSQQNLPNMIEYSTTQNSDGDGDGQSHKYDTRVVYTNPYYPIQPSKSGKNPAFPGPKKYTKPQYSMSTLLEGFFLGTF